MKYVLVILIIIPIIVLFSSFLQEETPSKCESVDPPFLYSDSKWVDSVFSKMTLDDKIGQLIMIGIFPNKGNDYIKAVTEIIRQYKIGGIMYYQGTPVHVARATNYIQKHSTVPVMVAIDAEWGLSMRLDSTPVFPRQMMLGAIFNEDVIYDMGIEIARQCKRLGININFAPVLDINNNSKNPVINSRSFGQSRVGVARKGFAYMQGLQDSKILAVGKHFPGHGDTEVDSHSDLPLINHSKKRIDSVELYPFKHLINCGIGGIMVGHLLLPALDSVSKLPCSASPVIGKNILRNSLNFKGLVFTDGLEMAGFTKFFKSGAGEVKALIAGADILLLPLSINQTIKEIKKAIQTGEISIDEINFRCKKILSAKKWFGLDRFKPINTKNIISDLNSSEAELTIRKLVESSITLIKNDRDLIPFKNLSEHKIASVSIGWGNQTVFQKTLSLYADIKHFTINKNSSLYEYEVLISKLAKYDVVIVGIHATHFQPVYYGITNESINFISRLAQKKRVIVDLFASPYSLSLLKNVEKIESIIVSYEDTKICQDLSAQLIFGGIPALGRLPVSAGNFPIYTGIIDKKTRLKYSIPRELKIDEFKLKKIDTLALDGIKQGAFPGCDILIAKDGVVFYHKAFGYHTFEKKDTMKSTHVFDLASITKMAATTVSIMRLYEEGKIKLNDKISEYIPELKNTNKKDIIIRDILTHHAQLVSWIPFYLYTYKNLQKNILRDDLYSIRRNDSSVQVADNLYIKSYFKDSIFKSIYKTRMFRSKFFYYSDIGFYLLYKAITNITGTDIDFYFYKNFGLPLGAKTLCYNPLNRFEKFEIVPTEYDKTYRKQLVQGFVHDYGAAMMGGLGGHAGLFGNANDLAKLMEMFLNEGKYGGIEYFKPETVRLFTSNATSEKNRRGLGFDKVSEIKKNSTENWASPESFGHSGFTGTLAWVDPVKKIVFIFLSNRICPDINNEKILKLELRKKIQNVVYDAMN